MVLKINMYLSVPFVPRPKGDRRRPVDKTTVEL